MNNEISHSTEEILSYAAELLRDDQSQIDRINAQTEALLRRQQVLKALADKAKELESRLEEVERDNQSLQSAIEHKSNDIAELKSSLASAHEQLKESKKLNAKVADKTDPGALEKAVRQFLNASKRKSQSKKETIKQVVTEMVENSKITLSDELWEQLSHFDDTEAVVEQHFDSVNFYAGSTMNGDVVRKGAK